MRRLLSCGISIALVALTKGVLLAASPATADVATVSINPIAGPPGTVITVIVPNCDGGTPGATLEEDFTNVVIATGTVSGSVVKITVPDGIALDYYVVHASCTQDGSTVKFQRVFFQVTAADEGAVNTPHGAVHISSPTGTTLSNLSSGPVPSGGPTGVTFPMGMIGFKVSSLSTGATTEVVLSTFSFEVTEWYDINGSTFTKLGAEQRCIPRELCYYLTLRLTDGGAGDQDGTANGVIVQQGAPAIPAPVPTTTAPTTPATAAPTVATAPLPRTGSTSGGLAALGGGIIVAGTAALAVSRRRIRGTRR
jgi:LPXTG-motif cell wall-anchored protein